MDSASYLRPKVASLVAVGCAAAFALLACQPVTPEHGEVPAEGRATQAHRAVHEDGEARDDTARGEKAAAPAPEEAEFLIGAYCPGAARGRPAFGPVLGRAGGWYADDEFLQDVISGGGVGELSVFAWDGRRAGVMSATGTAEVEGERLLIGSYMGSPPCAEEAVLGEEPAFDPACERALGGCGVAIANVKAEAAGALFGEDGGAPQPPSGDACLQGGELVVDVDGTGPAAYSLRGITAADPPAELVASGEEPGGCEASFAFESNVEDVRVDVLAVADFSRNGRADVLLGVGEGSARAWTLYSATSTAGRLDRAALARDIDARLPVGPGGAAAQTERELW